MFVAILFYYFSFLILSSALLVITSKNPINSVIFLIFSFFNSAGIFLIAGAEFLALIMLIVYVGAVAVLFLFVVMMLDVDFSTLKAEMAGYLPIALLIAVVLVMQLAMAFGLWSYADTAVGAREVLVNPEYHNTQALGLILYDRYFILFQLSGLILLVAMIGAIVLTVRHRKNVKRQNILSQIYRDPDKSLEILDVKPGQGL